MQDEFVYMSVTDLVRGYQKKAFSPVEVTRVVLDRIALLNPSLNCFCHLDERTTLDMARASESRWMKNEPKGLVDGVPVSIKDTILTRTWPTLKGSLTIDPNQPWPEDAPATARLREQGGIFIGKTATPEFGWKGVTDSSLTGTTRNPWNLSKTPGGSSGGAAAAVSAGMGCLALGTDGGGSIRIPASFTGIFGMKPSFGVVPAYPPTPSASLSQIGPLTRTVADASLLLDVITQPDIRDVNALDFNQKKYTNEFDKGIEGFNIGFTADLGYAAVDSEVKYVVSKAAESFAELGAHIEEASPGFEDPYDIWWKHFLIGAVYLLRDMAPADMERLDPELAQKIGHAAELQLIDYIDAVEARDQLVIRMRRFHKTYDILVTPTVAVPPFGLDRLGPESFEANTWVGWSPFTYPFNLTKQPAASVPCGFTADGLPVGLQIVGPLYADERVLRAAFAFESANPDFMQHPSGAGSS